MTEPNIEQMEAASDERCLYWRTAPPDEEQTIFDNENRPLTDGNGNYWGVAAPSQD